MGSVPNGTSIGGGTGFQPVNHGLEGHATSIHGQDSLASAITIRQGAYLPHWTNEQAIYSVTFRLADSLPKSVVAAWLAERENIIRVAKEMDRPLSVVEEGRLQYLFSERVDRYMDSGHGSCWMRQDAIAQIVTKAIRHFDGQRYRLFAWCIMPNHAHVVIQPLPGNPLPTILHSWKSFTANQANRALMRSGDFWQPEYYDHLIRDESDLAHSIEYALRNPERAGLKGWAWIGCGTGCQLKDHGQDAHATSMANSSEDQERWTRQ